MLRTIGRALLAPRAAPSGPVREMLAESLGDRSVAIAYWLPDREAFVDEAGHPVALPEPGSGRAWTAVEQDGRRVAAIVHDAALDTSPELVDAAAAASSLAIDNERLKADLRARVEDLRVSRLRIVEAADEARRRIERDLHDGAQQQLLALALELRVLRSSISDPEAGPLVDGLAVRLEAALSELRELARGIHPAILTRSGLDPAIAALAARAPVPVRRGERDRRPPGAGGRGGGLLRRGRGADQRRALRACAARRACRCAATATAHRRGRRRRRRRAARTSTRAAACAGCRTALAVVDGVLAIDSPPGAGTRLEARIPSPRDAMRRAAAIAALALLVVAARRLRRDDARARATHRASPRASRPASCRRRRPRPSGGVRIAVVTHGQASSPFWAIVRNGVEAAARQMDVVVELPRARRLQPGPHGGADRPGGRQPARRARRLDPRGRPGARRSAAR